MSIHWEDAQEYLDAISDLDVPLTTAERAFIGKLVEDGLPLTEEESDEVYRIWDEHFPEAPD